MSAQMSSMVKSYLERENRPFSANDVYNNMNSIEKKLSKTGVQRSLEELALNHVIKEKINGKQKIYFADQNNFEAIDDNRIQQINKELQELEDEYNGAKSDLNSKEKYVSSLKKSMTLDQLSQHFNQLQEEVNLLENRFKQIDGSVQDLDPQKNQEMKKKREKLVTEWRKRKRMANDMIDSILEGYPKKKKELIEEIGVETDEELNLTLPKITNI